MTVGYDPKIYEAVRLEFAGKAKRAEAAAEARAGALYKKLPALETLDRRLAGVGPRIWEETRKGKEGLTERLAALKKESDRLREERKKLLREAGFSEDPTEARYECPLCMDTGFVSPPEDPLSERMCSCLKKALCRASADATGIGALIAAQTFENFSVDYYEDKERARNNLARCRRYAEAPRGNLLLMGGTGLGKTHLSSAIAGRAIALPLYVVYETAGRLTETYENARFGRKSYAQEEDPTEKYTSCELLILDDLGSEMTTSFTVSALYTLLTERINRRLPTVISTNLSPAALIDRYTDRIASRLLGEFDPILFEGVDIRLRKKRG